MNVCIATELLSIIFRVHHVKLHLRYCSHCHCRNCARHPALAMTAMPASPAPVSVSDTGFRPRSVAADPTAVFAQGLVVVASVAAAAAIAPRRRPRQLHVGVLPPWTRRPLWAWILRSWICWATPW